jgi:hypothetical protein
VEDAMKNGQAKYEWIKARLAEGRTVYLGTQLRVTKITAKHLALIRVRNDSLEIRCGKHWIDYSYTDVRAA